MEDFKNILYPIALTEISPRVEEINKMIANGESSNKTIFTVVKEKKRNAG